MYGLMELIIWVVLGGFLDVCGAPAVSLSFGGKSKNDTGVVFAYRNGSWVNLGGGRFHSSKGFSQPKKEENYTSELNDLFRRINLTLPGKMGSEGVKAMRPSEKPLGELFLEWLSKHEGTVKPVAAIKSTPIPVVGLQIDFDDSTSARVMGRDFARVTPYPKAPASVGELPFFFGHPSRKTQKSSNQKKSVIIKRQQNPAQINLDPETAHVVQKGLDSDDDLRTRFYVRKRQVGNDVEEPVKFIIEPITISPLQLMNSDLIDLSSYFSNSESNMTKRHAIFSNPTMTVQNSSETFANPARSDEIPHFRRQRSFTEIFTPAPAKASAQPAAHNMPIFDAALPVESHVKKRHGKPFLHAKPRNEINPLTASPAAEESYSGQLMVRNEMPSDRKNKLNDLPKYVMKFLSQCKALIEQNYDEDSAKDNYDEDEALLRSNDNPNGKNEVSPRGATDDPFPGTQAVAKNTEIDEFESIRINKRPIKKKSKEDKGSIKISIDNGDSRIDSWVPTGPSKINTAAQLKVDAKNLLSAYDSDDLYDEDLDWHLSENHQPSEGKINRKMFFTSEVNTSTCRPIIADYAPTTDNYSPECTEEPEVTTLSSEQWKVLMDMVNERLPCPTTCATPSRKTNEETTKRTKQSTGVSDGNTMMPSTRTTKITPKNRGTGTTRNLSALKPNQCSRKTTPAKCSSTTTTCATTTSTCATTPSTSAITPTTCATTTTTTSTTTCPTTTDCTEETSTCGDDADATTEEEAPPPKNVKQKNKPSLPQRYLIKIETSKPKHYNELSHLQGRSRPNNWFDNIKSLKLLEGLRSNGQNLAKPGYNVLNPKSASMGFQNDPGNPEKMIAEGVIPLKTGSTLNLYISYVLNKTKAHKGKPLTGNIPDDKLSGAVPRKLFHDSKIRSNKA